MPAGSDELNQDRVDVVIKQSYERRKEFEEFISVVTKRADIEDTYAKSLEGLARQVDRYAQGNTSSSLTFAAFRSDQMHRVEQSRVFSQSLRDDVLVMLRDVINAQNAECKKLEKDAKKLEKDLSGLSEAVTKSKSRYLQSERFLHEEIITNEIMRLSIEFSKDRREKQQMRTRDIEKETKEYEQVYRQTLKQFNDFVHQFSTDMDKYLQRYEQHERVRIDKQVDGVMKMLVFESGMTKNFDYDIGNVSKQLGEAKAEVDIQSFISNHASQKPKLSQEQFSGMNNMLSRSVTRLVSRHTYTRIEYEVMLSTNQRKKEVKDFVEASYKGNVPQEGAPEEFRSEAFLQLAGLVDRTWKGEELEKDSLECLTRLCQEEQNRYMFAILHRYYGGMYNLQLNPAVHQQIVRTYRLVLDKCLEHKDVLAARKLLSLAFSQYLAEPKEANSKNAKKHELYQSLRQHPLWKQADFWDAAILESIQEELKTLPIQKTDTHQEVLDREKNAIFSQLASYCHNMVMMGLPTKIVRPIAGKYFELYGLDEEQSKHLSDTLSYAIKQFKELNGTKDVAHEQPAPEQYHRMSN